MLWLSSFISDFINNLILTCIFKKLNNISKKITIKEIIFLLIVSFLTAVIIAVFAPTVKLILKFLIMILLYKMLFFNKFSSITITVFLLFVSLVISELFFSTIFIVILNLEQSFFISSFSGIIITNLIIIFICYLIHSIKKIQKLEKYIINWYQEKNTFNIILLCILAEITMFVLSYQNYITIVSKINYFIWNIFLFGIIIFILGFFKEKTDNSKLLNDYDQLLKYSKEYEKEVVEKSKKQHEYQNQLIIIKSMIKSNDKKILGYIDSLISETYETHDSKLIQELSCIKSKGLKGLIYFKIKEMEDKKIKLFINVSGSLNKNKIWENCDNNIKDISRCLGVYIDNAIEASIISKDKSIIIEVLYDNDEIVFTISNTFSGNLDVNNFDSEGYSSKGKNRGYGLSLVKEIIDNNESLYQNREINGKYYVQMLHIRNNCIEKMK